MASRKTALKGTGWQSSTATHLEAQLWEPVRNVSQVRWIETAFLQTSGTQPFDNCLPLNNQNTKKYISFKNLSNI
jgi:hypothetical protein